jgi:hypothetical protein
MIRTVPILQKRTHKGKYLENIKFLLSIFVILPVMAVVGSLLVVGDFYNTLRREVVGEE